MADNDKDVVSSDDESAAGVAPGDTGKTSETAIDLISEEEMDLVSDDEKVASDGSATTIDFYSPFKLQSTIDFPFPDGDGGTFFVNSVAFSSDGSMLVCGWDKGVHVWNLVSGERFTLHPKRNPNLKTTQDRFDLVEAVACSPRGHYVASCVGDSVLVWDTNNKTIVGKGLGSGDWVWDQGRPRYPDQQIIMVGDIVQVFKRGGFAIVVEISPDEIKVQVDDEMADIFIVSPVLLKLASRGDQEDTGHTGHVNSVAFHPEGNQIVSGADDGDVKIWDFSPESGLHLVRSLNKKEITDRVLSVAFSHDGTQVAYGTRGHGVRVWTLKSDVVESIGKQNLKTSTAHSVAFNANGIVAGYNSKVVYQPMDIFESGRVVFNKNKQRILGTFASKDSYPHTVTVAFSPLGDQIVAGSDGGHLKIWEDSGSGRWANSTYLQARGVEGWDPVTCIAFSPIGDQIATGGSKLKVWSTGREVKMTDQNPFIFSFQQQLKF